MGWVGGGGRPPVSSSRFLQPGSGLLWPPPVLPLLLELLRLAHIFLPPLSPLPPPHTCMVSRHTHTHALCVCVWSRLPVEDNLSFRRPHSSPPPLSLPMIVCTDILYLCASRSIHMSAWTSDRWKLCAYTRRSTSRIEHLTQRLAQRTWAFQRNVGEKVEVGN